MIQRGNYPGGNCLHTGTAQRTGQQMLELPAGLERMSNHHVRAYSAVRHYGRAKPHEITKHASLNLELAAKVLDELHEAGFLLADDEHNYYTKD